MNGRCVMGGARVVVGGACMMGGAHVMGGGSDVVFLEGSSCLNILRKQTLSIPLYI